MAIVDKKEIPLWKRLIVRLVGEAFAYKLGELHYYFGYCPKHGYFIDHLLDTTESFVAQNSLEKQSFEFQKL
jgi:hypothetical protein